MNNRFGEYISHTNKISDSISKLSVKNIDKELNKLNKMNIPKEEKDFVKMNIYSKLPYRKRKALILHFGQTPPPTTQPPVTQPPSVTQPPVTQPPVTQPPVTQPQQAVVAGTVPTTDYAGVAGAIQGAEIALAQAGQALAAQQGLTGFGYR